MAAGAFTVYSNAVLAISQKQINLAADTFVMSLHTNSYIPAPNTDSAWANVSAYELATGLGYTAGGQVLTGEADTLATATVTFTAGSPSWAGFSAGPFRYAVITHRAGALLVSGDLLLCCSDLTGGGTITGSGGAYTVTISGSGIFNITHTP